MNQLLSALSRLRYGRELRPQRDWQVLLATAATLLVLGALWHSWLYAAVKSGSVIGSAPASTPSASEDQSLVPVEQYFLKRAQEGAKYATGAYSFADPSQ